MKRISILIVLCLLLCLPMMAKPGKPKKPSTRISVVKPNFACDSGGQGSSGCSAGGNGCSVSCAAGYYSCCIGTGSTSNCSCVKGGEPEQ